MNGWRTEPPTVEEVTAWAWWWHLSHYGLSLMHLSVYHGAVVGPGDGHSHCTSMAEIQTVVGLWSPVARPPDNPAVAAEPGDGDSTMSITRCLWCDAAVLNDSEATDRLLRDDCPACQAELQPSHMHARPGTYLRAIAGQDGRPQLELVYAPAPGPCSARKGPL